MDASPGSHGTHEASGPLLREIGELADRVREFCPDLMVSGEVVPGTGVSGALVEASARTDLIVVGREHGEHRLLGAGPSLGRVAHRLLHPSHAPVQIVPPGHASRAGQDRPDDRHAPPGRDTGRCARRRTGRECRGCRPAPSVRSLLRLRDPRPRGAAGRRRLHGARGTARGGIPVMPNWTVPNGS